MIGAELIAWLRPDAAWLLLPWAALLAGAYLRVAGRGRSDVGGTEAADLESPWRAVIDPALLPDLRQPAGAAVRGGGADNDHGRRRRPSASTSNNVSGGASNNASDSASGSPRVPSANRPSPRHDWSLALLGLLLIAALAGPQLKRAGAGDRPLRPDAARVLVVDLSPGFSALDDARQQQVRIDLRSFLRRLPAGETALVVVAGEAWLVVPPTEDVAALDGFIAELSADAVPVPGDQPAAGLALALRTLAATGARSREIYWLRAGAPPPLDVAAIAESGVAAKFLQAAAGGDDWLRQTPSATGGATGWRNSLLNLAPRPEAGLIDLGPYLILLALPLAAWRLRRFAALAIWPLLLLAGSSLPLPAEAAPSADERGVADYRAGRYDAAATAFAELPADDARAHYNRGNALARAGRLRAALAAYDESLRLRPDDASARHNREIVARLLQPPNPPPDPPPSSPPPSPSPKPPPPAAQSAEAQRAAEQWLRRPPTGNDGLLRRKLAIEEARRSGKAAP